MSDARDERPTVSAIVVTHGSPHHVEACLAALRRSEGVDLRILVIDNASPEATRAAIHELAGRFGAALIRSEENLGFAGGNNLGIDAALADGVRWVVELNDDTEIHPDALRRLVEALRANPRAAAAAPLMLYEGTPVRIWWGGGALSIVRGTGRHLAAGQLVDTWSSAGTEVTGCLSGCCIAFRAEALRREGGFRAGYFMYGEDVELSLRYRRAGWQLLFVPGARLVHKVPFPEPVIAPHKIVLRDRNRRRMVREHYRWWERAAFTIWFAASRLVHLVRYVLHADRARASAILRGAVAR